MSSPNPKYKFTHFNAADVDLAEPICWMFVLAEEAFVDNRVERDENWEEQKSEYFWEKLPTLEVDGVTIHQTISIARFVARRCGLVGKNEFEATKCDEIVDALLDFRSEWVEWSIATGKAKPEIMDRITKIHVPKYFKKMDEIIKSNTTGNGWVVGESVTWADLFIAYFMITFHENVKANVLDTYKHLKKLKNQVFQFPAIAEYVRSRSRPTTKIEESRL